MENSNPVISHQSPISTHGYNPQLPQVMWSGSKSNETNSNENTIINPYSQQINQHYQAPYPSHTNDFNRYATGISKDHNSNTVSYSSQYQGRQTNYSLQSQKYLSLKNNTNSNVYCNNINPSKNITSNNLSHMPKKYANPNLGVSQAVPHSSQVSCSTTQYNEHANYSMQNVYMSSSNHGTNEHYIMPQTLQPLNSSHKVESIHTVSLIPHQVSQVSSIPTPPETSLTNEGLPSGDTSTERSDAINMSIPNSFALPGMVSHLANNMQSMTNSAAVGNSNNSLQPPPNVDEGSQASIASASSSIPDDQNMKANSKPNFSYPPTPNTLSSPGAASMSSFHDDLECISSPGWPKTPASPVANNSYEFCNIKRPENLLKLYTLSDEPDRRYFLDKLIVFNEDRGCPITQCPTISKQPLDVFRVYLTVKERGGFVEVTNAKRWKDIAGAIGVGASSSAAYTLRKQYMKLLLPFECKFDRGGIDPQPIINMVEASSRKKGKNSGVTGYGNQNLYNQSYSQMERYSGYPGSYQSSRYQCNNPMDYQSTSSSVHFLPTTTHNPSGAVVVPNQYSQYPTSSQPNYAYYQSNTSNSHSYNSNLHVNLNSNICQYGRSATSTPVPQEQPFYQYSSQQNEVSSDLYNSNQGFSMEIMQASTNQSVTNNDSEFYLTADPILSTSSQKSLESTQKFKSKDNYTYQNISDCSSAEIIQDKISSNNSSYAVNKNPDQNLTSIKKSPVSLLAAPFQHSIPENTIERPTEVNYSPNQLASPQTVSSYPSRNPGPYHSHTQSSFSNQNMPYQEEYRNKVLSHQYEQYVEIQNDSYQVSAEIQVDRSKPTLSSDNSEISAKIYQYNQNSSKCNQYSFSINQNHKEIFSNLAYGNTYSNHNQRAWCQEQISNSYPMATSQRPPIKSKLSSPEKIQSEIKPRKSSTTFREATQNQNSLMPAPVYSQPSMPNKTQLNKICLM